MGLETLRTLYNDFTDSGEYKQLSYSDIKTLDSRVSRLIKSGLESPSLDNLQKSQAGQFISAKGYFSASKFNKAIEKANEGDRKAQIQVEETYKALSGFTRKREPQLIFDNDGNVIGRGKTPSDTSTVKGARKYEKEISKRIPGYDKLTTNQKRNLWRAYDDSKKFYLTSSKEDSTRLQALAKKIVDLDKLKLGHRGEPLRDRLHDLARDPEFMQKWKNDKLTDRDIQKALRKRKRKG